MILHFRGRDLCINKTDLSPVNSFTLLCMALHSGAIQGSKFTVKHRHSPHSKIAHSTQLTL
ncbi:unnamed protein product [Staurois parvus]|uniref:Uncharacterized protein n=1 Tax=Staurois parvus TaxID=386267 RepID=A0ABN9EZP3_9NEOB|nr:unnamed protein product [Staurois parvus]